MPTRIKQKTTTEKPGVSSTEERLSSVAENYLLCVYKFWEEQGWPSLSQLANLLKLQPPTEGLGTTLASVTGMVRRMKIQGLVVVGSDKRLSLTAKGVVHAEDIVRRHRLAECMVVELLGVELYKANIEAHRLEHGISPELEAKIRKCLGSPTRSPFGRPIPGSEYQTPPVKAISLDEGVPGLSYQVDRIPEEDVELLRFLADSYIIPDREIKVLDVAPYRGVISLDAAGQEVVLGYEVAKRVWVRPGQATANK